MTTKFTFPYAEYVQACQTLFKSPPSMAHLFKVKIVADTKFTGSGGAFAEADAYDMTYFVESTTTPSLTMAAIVRRFQGVEMKLPALSDYGEKTITLKFYDTQDRFIYNAIRAWQKQIVDYDFNSDTLGKVDLTKVSLSDRITMQAMSTDGALAPSWCMYGVFPMRVTDVTGLGQGEISNIMTFDVEFKYRWAGYHTVAAADQTA